MLWYVLGMKDIFIFRKTDSPALTTKSLVHEVFSIILLLSVVSKPAAEHHLEAA